MPLLKQLSLFLENEPGHLKVPCQALGRAGIDILTMSLADTQQFGILRLVVLDWELAKRVLEDAGCVVTVTDLLAIEVQDRPGGLAELLERFEEARLGIEYLYPLPSGRVGGTMVLVFRTDDPHAAAARLRHDGVRVLDPADVFSRMNP
jgi:hypothetical protein